VQSYLTCDTSARSQVVIDAHDLCADERRQVPCNRSKPYSTEVALALEEPVNFKKLPRDIPGDGTPLLELL
jgi:hypothetical protein